jgi:hypothetical protein
METEQIGPHPAAAGPPPPRLALALGGAGVLPFAALSLAIAFGADVPLVANEPAALIAYAAIISSFMAGVHWGLAMRAADAPDGPLARRLRPRASSPPSSLGRRRRPRPARRSTSSPRCSQPSCRSACGRSPNASRRAGTDRSACN